MHVVTGGGWGGWGREGARGSGRLGVKEKRKSLYPPNRPNREKILIYSIKTKSQVQVYFSPQAGRYA